MKIHVFFDLDLKSMFFPKNSDFEIDVFFGKNIDFKKKSKKKDDNIRVDRSDSNP